MADLCLLLICLSYNEVSRGESLEPLTVFLKYNIYLYYIYKNIM
jgi:hypothetical protein